VINGGAGILDNGLGIKVAGVGSFGLNATQLSNAGIIKPGSDIAVNYALNSGKTLEQAMPNNIFTGQNGVTNLNQFLNDTSSQTKAAASLLVDGENKLKSSGIISGNEHSTQTAGLIMSTASLGLKATSNFLASNSASGSVGLSPAALADKLPGGIAGSASQLISGGNFAAGLADKSLVALSGIKLGGIDVAKAVKGFASSLYSSVVSAFKPLQPNVPQNLTTINAASDPTSALGAAVDTATKVASDPKVQGLAMKALEASVPGAGIALSVAQSASSGQGLNANTLVKSAVDSSVPGVNVSSLGGLPGGMDAISNNPGDPVTSSGMSSISGAVKNIAGNVSGGQFGSELAAAKSIVGGASLATIAMGGLDPSKLSSLNSLLSAIGHGALNISLPKISSDTFNVSGLKAKAKSLLGDSKIPALSFGTNKAPEPNVSAESQLASITGQLEKEMANYEELFEKYQTALSKYGYDSTQANDAYSSLHASVEKSDKLAKQAEKIITI
jgi:hypothetical protein